MTFAFIVGLILGLVCGIGFTSLCAMGARASRCEECIGIVKVAK